MKTRMFILALAFVALAMQARATAITGKLALAGLDAYTSSGVTFTNPAVVLTATDDLSILASAVPVNFSNIANFATEPGQTLFTWSSAGVTVTMMIDTMNVLDNTANFLNVMGTATMTRTGFIDTAYNYDFTSTRPDGTTSYTMDISNASPVSEPGSLLLVATGLISMVILYRARKGVPKIN